MREVEACTWGQRNRGERPAFSARTQRAGQQRAADRIRPAALQQEGNPPNSLRLGSPLLQAALISSYAADRAFQFGWAMRSASGRRAAAARTVASLSAMVVVPLAPTLPR